MDFSQLSASNGSGEAVRASVTAVRTINSTVLKVDFITNWPNKFIATSGTLLSDGTLNPSTVQVFYGHLNGLDIIIDGYAPGYTDKGNSVGDIVVIKPTTAWADTVASSLSSFSTDANQGWTSIKDPATGAPIIPTVLSSNAQREAVLKYANIDLTGVVPVGSKWKGARTSTVPTQSATFVAANSQYASKTSPAGINFTQSFTAETYITIPSYPTAQMAIIGMDSAGGAGSGWEFGVQPSGVLVAYSRNASGACVITSYRSLKTSKRTHVAVTFDLATGTLKMYFDGELVPATVSIVGTTLVQATGVPLSIGKRNSAVAYSNMTLSHTRLWNTARTQQQILDNMGKVLAGNETGLISQWTFNGNTNDSNTTNANNLTASGGLTATTVDNPYSAVEFGVTTKVAKVGSDTQVTLFTGPCVIPNETLGATSYSTVEKPFGFPSEKGKWALHAIFKNLPMNASTTSGVWANPTGLSILVPTGAWGGTYSLFDYINKNSTVAGTQYTMLSPQASAIVDDYLPTQWSKYNNIGQTDMADMATIPVTDLPVLSAPTTIYGIMQYSGGPTISHAVRPDMAVCSITLYNRYIS